MPSRFTIAVVLVASLLAGCGDSGPTPARPAQAADVSEPVTGTTAPATGTNVLLVGDSIMDELAAAVSYAVEAGGRDQATFVLGPALPHTEADLATWQRTIDTHQPDVVVLYVGHWERLRVLGDFATGDLLVPGTYRTEVVDPALAALRDAGARLLWLAPLPIRDPEESAFTRSLGETYRSILAGRSDAEYLDVSGGAFDPGERRSDGIHLCPDAQLRIARLVVEHLQPLLTRPPAPGWGEAWRGTVHEPGGCAPYDGEAG